MTTDALRACEHLRDTLKELMAVSIAQLEALDRFEETALIKLVRKKETLLAALSGAVEAIKSHGWSLTDHQADPSDKRCKLVLSEAREWSRKVIAHDRYMVSQMSSRKSDVANELVRVAGKLSAVSGYRHETARGRTLDRAC